MNKIQAIEAMRLGNIVRHESFTDDEYMFINDAGSYQFEDGVVCSDGLFWFDRSGPEWDEGWSLYNSNPVVSWEAFDMKLVGDGVYMTNRLDMRKHALKRGRYVSVRTEPKIHRNEPCMCGSGLKYKRCCLEK